MGSAAAVGLESGNCHAGVRVGHNWPARRREVARIEIWHCEADLVFSDIITKTVPKYSIVVPLHNEEENVTDLYDRLKVVMEAHGESFEIVLVDDGSTDHTFAMLREIAAVDSRVTVVKLRRNFGQTAGLAAGFDHARGEYIIAMDGDLQHDPNDIPLFLEKIAAGYDIVSGWRRNRVDNFWMRRIPSRIANWMMAKISGVDIHDFGTTFKAYRRDILEQVPLYGELHRFIPSTGLVAWRHYLRSADQKRQPGARGFALWHLAHLPCLFRSAYDSFFAALSLTAAAFLWQLRHDEHLRRDGSRFLAGNRKIPAPCSRHGLARPANDGRSRVAARWLESACDWIAGRDAGSPLSRA